MCYCYGSVAHRERLFIYLGIGVFVLLFYFFFHLLARLFGFCFVLGTQNGVFGIDAVEFLEYFTLLFYVFFVAAEAFVEH